MRTLRQRYARVLGETTWVLIGQGLSALATLVGLRLITEFVPPQVYGTVALALGVVALAHGLAAGPLMQAVLRLYPDVAPSDGERPLRRAALQSLRKPTLLALAALALTGAGWSLHRPQEGWAVVAALLLFVVEVARSVEITFLNAARRQREMALLMIADAWARPLCAVALVWLLGAHASTVLAGYLAGALIALIGFWLVRRTYRQVVAQPVRALLPASELSHRLRAYAWPLTALPLIGWVSGQADRYLIGAFAGVAPAGLYAALYGLASKPFLMLSASVELVLRQPYYARVSAGDRPGELRVLLVWLAGVAGASIALCGLIVLLHAPLATLLLAAEYRTHSSLMGWIAAGYVLLAAAQVLERVCYAHHDTRGVAMVQATGALLSVTVAAPLVWRYGIAGAAWAVPLYFGAQLLITLARARRAWRGTGKVAHFKAPASMARTLGS
ncbi:MAG TPA: oligosaccharide flippase family protein [Nevskiales bacterium]|nr:oligosaccharide flippase family protein [Nevskiales bacterium]